MTDAAQLQELAEASRISHPLIVAARLFTESDPRELAKMTGVPRAAWKPEHLPALIFPYLEPGSPDAVMYSAKPRTPFAFPDGHTAKYVRTKASGIAIYLPPPMLEPGALDLAEATLLTEGEKKTLSAASAGFRCVGLAGVDMWREKKGSKRPHSTLARIAATGAELFIAFDSDRETNIGGVRRAEKQLEQALTDAGAKVFIVRIPAGPQGKKWGLDDFLAAHGSEGAAQLRGLLELARRQGPAAKAEPVTASTEAKALTDVGNAERLVRHHGADLRFAGGAWFAWNGSQWERDDGAGAYRCAVQTSKDIFLEAREAPDRRAADELAEHASKSQNVSRISAMVKLASVDASLRCDVEAFDADPWLFNTPSGLVDLRSGTVTSHARDALASKIAGATVGAATSPRWNAFLDVILPDEEVRAFIQRLAGSWCSGLVTDQVIGLFYGTGANGKSTFLETIAHVLGDYARPVPRDLLLVKPHGDSHSCEVAALHGTRLAFSAELGEGRKVDAGRLKGLTGGDRITARWIRGNPFSFAPTHKLLLLTNHLPRVPETDDGTWRRLLVVPFTVQVAPQDRDSALPEKLRQEAPGVLRWLLDGCLAWQRDGLRPPEIVRAVAQQYRASEDVLGRFLEDRMCVAQGQRAVRTQAEEAYRVFCEWARAEGEPEMSARAFGSALIARGFERLKTNGRHWYLGLGVLKIEDRSESSGRDEEGQTYNDSSAYGVSGITGRASLSLPKNENLRGIG